MERKGEEMTEGALYEKQKNKVLLALFVILIFLAGFPAYGLYGEFKYRQQLLKDAVEWELMNHRKFGVESLDRIGTAEWWNEVYAQVDSLQVMLDRIRADTAKARKK
jgi:hypothetical protein